jgi:hypothetical protein
MDMYMRISLSPQLISSAPQVAMITFWLKGSEDGKDDKSWSQRQED